MAWNEPRFVGRPARSLGRTDWTAPAPNQSMMELHIMRDVFFFSISDKTAEDMGMKELFKAVRTDACEIYRCKEKTSTVTTTPQLKEEKE